MDPAPPKLRLALHQDVWVFFWFLTDLNQVQKESTRKSSMNAIVLEIFERKMDECVNRTWMFPLPSKVNRGIKSGEVQNQTCPSFVGF